MMADRLNNDFQFLDVGRAGPEKIKAEVRKQSFAEIYEPFAKEEAGSSPIAVWSVVTHTVHGNVRYITIFQTG